MGVNIRETQLKNNRLRLTLDVYQNGKSHYENLKLFIYQKPASQSEREHNKRTRALAESIKAKRIIELQDKRFNNVTGFNSKASFLQYFKKLTNDRKRQEANYENWLSTYKHLFRYCNGKDLTFEECDEVFLNGFKHYLLNSKINRGNRRLAENSSSAYFNKIKAALNQAHDERLIINNPGKRIKGIKPKETKREYLLVEELRKLTVTPCEIPVLKNAFLFSCLTGLRWSDVQKLTWSEIQYSEAENRYKILFTQKKTQGVQYHPISDQTVKLLGKRGADDDRVFVGLRYSAWYNLKLQQWIMDAGINKRISYHVSRHTFATALLASGADIYTLSSLLGHADLKTTQVYAKIINNTKNRVVDLLPDIGI